MKNGIKKERGIYKMLEYRKKLEGKNEWMNK